MEQFPLVVAAGFLEDLPILEIIKAGAAGLAVLVAILSYKLTREVVLGNADTIRADLAKFSWKASLVLVLLMVSAEAIHFFNPLPVLGIETNGWNAREFGSPLNVRIWERKMTRGRQVGKPFKAAVSSDIVEYEIQGISPVMTIHLEGMMGRMNNQTAVNTQLVSRVQEIELPNATDAGPEKAP